MATLSLAMTEKAICGEKILQVLVSYSCVHDLAAVLEMAASIRVRRLEMRDLIPGKGYWISARQSGFVFSPTLQADRQISLRFVRR